MTGWAELAGVPMPLSALTVRSLRDLGYTTDVTKADPFVAPSAAGRRLRKNNSPKIHLGADILRFELQELPTQVKHGRNDEFEAAKKKYQERRGGRT